MKASKTQQDASAGPHRIMTQRGLHRQLLLLRNLWANFYSWTSPLALLLFLPCLIFVSVCLTLFMSLSLFSVYIHFFISFLLFLFVNSFLVSSYFSFLFHNHFFVIFSSRSVLKIIVFLRISVSWSPRKGHCPPITFCPSAL